MERKGGRGKRRAGESNSKKKGRKRARINGAVMVFFGRREEERRRHGKMTLKRMRREVTRGALKGLEICEGKREERVYRG